MKKYKVKFKSVSPQCCLTSMCHDLTADDHPDFSAAPVAAPVMEVTEKRDSDLKGRVKQRDSCPC